MVWHKIKLVLESSWLSTHTGKIEAIQQMTGRG
jgi:hypothetical protein